MQVVTRLVAVWLIVTMVCPPTAFALREKETAEKNRATLAGLEEALRDPTAALTRLASLASPIPVRPEPGRRTSTPSTPFALSPVEGRTPPATTGLEERPEWLGVKAWWATVGHWGDIRHALARFDDKTRHSLRGQVNRLVKQMVIVIQEPYRHYALPLLLKGTLPAVATALTPEQFTAALALATRLAERGIHPYATLRYALPAIAQASPTPAAFEANLTALESFLVRLVEQKIHPYDALSAFPTVAQASPTPAAFQANLTALESFVVRLVEQKIHPYDALSAFPTVAQASPTPAAFQATLTALELFVVRLMKEPRIGLYAIRFALPAVANALTPEQFTAALALATRLAAQQIDPAATLYALPAVAKASRTSGEFRTNLTALEAFVIQGGVPWQFIPPAAPATGLEERQVAEARDVAVAAWGQARGVMGVMPAGPLGQMVLVFEEQALEMVPWAVMHGIPVAVRADGAVANGLEELLARLPGPKAPYAIGSQAAAHFLREYERSVVVTSRAQLLALVGLEEHDLPPVEAQAITATSTFLNLAA